MVSCAAALVLIGVFSRHVRHATAFVVRPRPRFHLIGLASSIGQDGNPKKETKTGESINLNTQITDVNLEVEEFLASYTPLDDDQGDVAPPTTSAPAEETAARSGEANRDQDVEPAEQVVENVKSIWDTEAPEVVQGNSLRTWSSRIPNLERVQVFMRTEGRPLNADVELWCGPDNTPLKLRVYIDNGLLRPFATVIETPGPNNAIAIRNTATMEYPLSACVEAEVSGAPPANSAAQIAKQLAETSPAKIIQGGAVYTKPFGPSVENVQLLLKSEAGRPMAARIELLQGPNNVKQVMEIYSEHGIDLPFFVVVETPGSGNVVRIVNTATMEYPLVAHVEPFLIDESVPDGSNGGFFIVV